MRENNRSQDRRPDNRNSRSGHNPRSQGSQNSRNSSNILPSSRILESYEDIAPGSVNKLLDMAKKEQEHRHAWQDKYLKFHNFSYKTGLIFGFIYNIALLYLIYNLIKEGNQSLALKLFVINTGLLIFAIVVTTIERRITTRKPPRRTHQNQNRDRHPSKPASQQPK